MAAGRRRRRYNELMGFVIALYGLALFFTDPVMRADLLEFLLADRFENPLGELLLDAFLWLYAIAFGGCALAVVLGPFGSTPNVRGEREVIEIIIVTVSLVCAIVIAVRAVRGAAELWFSAIAVASAAIAVWETRELDKRDAGDEVDTGEARPLHALVAGAFTATLFIVLELGTDLHWSESLASASAAALAFGFALPFALPLMPLGWRARDMHDGVQKDRYEREIRRAQRRRD